MAIKILPAQFSDQPEAVGRFVREARAAARLKHPNIVGVLNVGEEQGKHFIIMDYVDGKSLQTILDERGQLPESEALQVLRQIADALALAYRNQIVHRDIKPDNILVDKDGVARLADLGLAKRTGEDHGLTQTGAAMGTPYFISPEAVRDARSADYRSDIYSLGCTLYRMLCGDVPFRGGSFYDVLDQHLNAPVPDPLAVNPGISPAVAAMIRRMMAKKPEDRYQTPEELRAALTGTQHQTQARASGNGRTRPWQLAAGAALLLLAIVAGIARLAQQGGGAVRSDSRGGVPAASTGRPPATPDSAGAAFALARAALDKGDARSSAEQFAELARRFPDDPLADEALLEQGKLLVHELGQPKQALRAFRALLTGYPETDLAEEVLFRTAEAVDRITGGGPKAAEAFRRVEQTIPASAFAELARQRRMAIESESR